MTIKAQDVKELREKTGLGMMECKKANEEANGKLEEAIKNLRKSSALKAEKKASRTAVEGVITSKISDKEIRISFSIIIRINPNALRLNANGSLEPVGFSFMDQKPVRVSILSAKATTIDIGELGTLSLGPNGA